MSDEFTKWQNWAKAIGFVRAEEVFTQLGYSTALNVSWCGWEARAKLTKPLSGEQRKALIESAINSAEEDQDRPDMKRYKWLIDAVEIAHGIG